MLIRGRAWKFGDDVSTDHIAPGRYYHLRSNLPEFLKHVFEDADLEFSKEIMKGRSFIVVGGSNFGKGSSREHAARLIKMAGSPVVLAKSFSRIFYRNCFNIGMPALILDTDPIGHLDELEIDLEGGKVRDLTKGIELEFEPIPEVMRRIMKEGVVEYVKSHGDLIF